MKNWLQNIILVSVSVIFLLITLEYVVLQFFITATDVARVEFKDDMIRYRHNQQGVTKLSNEFSAPFSINENGWNSHHKRYSIDKNNKTRVAVIGDSYIAALEPGYKNAIPFLLEQKLGSNKYEVYNFGIGGAHLAQYLHMFNKEVLKYEPSVIIFLIIHNDFSSSYQKDLMASGRYGGTFLRLSIAEDGQVVEIPPRPYEPKWDKLLNFRFMRYIFYQYKLRTRISYIKSLVLNEQYKMNMDASMLTDNKDKDKILANYVVSNIMKIATERGIKILFAMNGDTQSIYQNATPDERSQPNELNTMMKKTSEDHGAYFLDLHGNFHNEFTVNHKRFEFKTDGHWNPYGQAIATEALVSKTTKILNAPPN
ncbi:MAG: SGNH/GDSL hydrolase family protein [Nitrospinaceae bacterium]|nr:SGNH/GDSL hydrolase family protein [Nitrospina sp.]MBT5869362.1 SGNH/GDSL hydrolase family protein [Nitrospinaceae bacterium]MBT6347130.1 SGNH/GDSL hydrolase family protein [Nitrospina sp.]